LCGCTASASGRDDTVPRSPAVGFVLITRRDGRGTPTISLPRKGCDELIGADNEDELVTQMQIHADRAHDLNQSSTRQSEAFKFTG
jgi:Protein of unknown function (DUF1059)